MECTIHSALPNSYTTSYSLLRHLYSQTAIPAFRMTISIHAALTITTTPRHTHCYVTFTTDRYSPLFALRFLSILPGLTSTLRHTHYYVTFTTRQLFPAFRMMLSFHSVFPNHHTMTYSLLRHLYSSSSTAIPAFRMTLSIRFSWPNLHTTS